MATLQDVLAQIRQHESGGDYGKRPDQNVRYPASHASGAYQFQPATWRQYTAASGVGTQYSEAYQAPASVQDAVAAYAAISGPGINSSALWGASAPPGGYPSFDSTGALTPFLQAIAGDTGGTPVTGPAGSGIFGEVIAWVERGFLIIVGLVIVAFGLWHLMGAPSSSDVAKVLRGVPVE